MNRKRLIFTAGLALCLFAVVVIGNRHAINAQIHLQNAEALFGEALFRNLVEATGRSQTACRAYANGLIAESSQPSEGEPGIFFRHVDECDGRRILFVLKELARGPDEKL